MRRDILPLAALKSWCKLNNIELTNVELVTLKDERGSGVVASRDLSGKDINLMHIPRELVLSLESIWIYAKSDQQLHEVLEAIGASGKVKHLPSFLL